MNSLWILHFACVAWMTGVIWLIQLVHYPLMKFVQRDQFARFHHSHCAWIPLIVVPPMMLELLSAISLLLWTSSIEGLDVITAWSCFSLSALVFLATAIFSIPQHRVLGNGFQAKAHNRLVKTNWIRTLLWSIHFGLCFFTSLKIWRSHG